MNTLLKTTRIAPLIVTRRQRVKVFAMTNVPQNFRNHIELLNEKDMILMKKPKEQLVKSYEHKDELVDELQYILIGCEKPISPETKIKVRRILLVLLETCNDKTRHFLMSLCKYYECL